MNAADPSPARRGKIARLPQAIREEVNQRLHDGQNGGEICAWLNGLASVKAMLADKFKCEEISEANLSNWRLGGFQDWLDDNSRADEIRANAEMAMRIAQASGGGISEGAAAILAGKIISGIEVLSAEDLPGTVLAVARLRKMELESRRVHLGERRENREDFKAQVAACELFLEWSKDQEAARIVADKGMDQESKVAALRLRMFGERPADLRDPRAVAIQPPAKAAP